MTGTLTLTEDADWYFDAESAEKPCTFIERYCVHAEGPFARQPFILHPVQRQIVRDLFGWRSRATALRRFTDCYWEGAVGSAKSALLSAIGLYGLCADGEQGAQVYSLASTFGQAQVVFETAKVSVKANAKLGKRLRAIDRKIRHPASNSVWHIVSGKGPGAGCRPSLCLADELHAWTGTGAYKDLRDRMVKRQQPLMITATNAGKSRASFCWTLREKAVAALEGKGPPSLYPIIWSADEDAATDDPEAWRKANPLLGVTVAESSVAEVCAEAMKDPDDEAEFRRLYLGIWPKTAGGRWLDLSQWDRCCEPPDEECPADAPTYWGVDLSACDDLSAAVSVRVTPTRFYVSSHFWLPKPTADLYHSRDGIPYPTWAAEGHLTLLNEPTISSDALRQIAAYIIERGKSHPIKAVCYDPYRSSETIAALEGAGIVCVGIRQGHSVSPGCFELERRLKEGTSICIEPNPVLRWNAENAEVVQDTLGNIRVKKPNARGRFGATTGTRALKVDGISALVTAMTEARRHNFPAAKKQWKGTILKVG